MSDEEAVIRRTEYTWHPIMPSLLTLLQDLRDSLKFRPAPANLGAYASIAKYEKRLEFPDKEANARRLVACWNEHDDLVHDNARLYQSLQGEMQGRLKAEQERDEALAAFSDLYTEVMVEFGYCPDPIKFEAILAKHQKVTG